MLGRRCCCGRRKRHMDMGCHDMYEDKKGCGCYATPMEMDHMGMDMDYDMMSRETTHMKPMNHMKHTNMHEMMEDMHMRMDCDE